MAAKRAEEKRIAEEARAAIEELELQELKKRLAEEEQKQLAILEAEANGEAPPVVATSSSSARINRDFNLFHHFRIEQYNYMLSTFRWR